MKTVIVGCGRVGSVLADAFDRAGHQVVVLDTKTSAFDRLPGAFKGAAVRGDGTDEDTLRRAGAADADVFIAMTEGDNRNIMAAQLATEALGARKVIAKINDPLRASAYAELGIATLCRTNLMAAAVSKFLDATLSFGPGLSAPTGQHPGGEHHGSDDGPDEATGLGRAPIRNSAPVTTDAADAAPATSPTPTSAPVAPASAREG
ncbi:MAG: TrkA family potassium uptake protein [Chloroflexi bacterium]|nr:TrkA family potassium uptake protein [Chloroflexota bacterium]